MTTQAARVMEHRLPESVLRVAERPMQPRCARLVRSCYGYEEWSPRPLARSEFANASVVMILEFGPPLRVSNGEHASSHAGGFLAGLHDGPTRTEHRGYQAGVQLNLAPLAARLLLGVPLAEIAHRIVAATDVFPRAQRALVGRLGELDSWEARLDAVEALIATAAESEPPAGFRELAFAIEQIERNAGRIQIRALARELGWSERRLQRTFAEQIGVSPKLFARLVRFDALVARVRRESHESWATATHALGYFDQSHLVRDVRQFTGVTPSAAKSQMLPLNEAAA
jgi:AraC-like DNA-binding protein